MLIELLTPLMLASSPVTMPAEVGFEYSHALQRSVSNNPNLKLAASTMTNLGTSTTGHSFPGHYDPQDTDVAQDSDNG